MAQKPTTKTVTKQLLSTYKCVKDASGWVSVQEIAENTNLRKGTINRHLKYLVESNTLEVLKGLTFYLYRISNDETSEVKKQLDHLLTIAL